MGLKPITIVSYSQTENLKHESINKAAQFFGISFYSVLNACFTEEPVNNVYFDFGNEVTDGQVLRLKMAWLNAKCTSRNRKEFKEYCNGKLKKGM